jgi:hypothetical protein
MVELKEKILTTFTNGIAFRMDKDPMDAMNYTLY